MGQSVEGASAGAAPPVGEEAGGEVGGAGDRTRACGACGYGRSGSAAALSSAALPAAALPAAALFSAIAASTAASAAAASAAVQVFRMQA